MPRSRYAFKSSGQSNGRRTHQRTNVRSKYGSYIDPRKFVATATITEQEVYAPTHSFADFALNQTLHDNIAAKGFTSPSPIQDQAIPAGLAGQDVIGIAGTGTGKTTAFALPILQRLMSDQNSAAIIIAPTRELAQQIEDECRSLAKGSGLRSAILIGGTGMGGQLRDLQARPRVIIGTPGRIKDHLQRGSLMLQRVNLVVLDEVDRMLDMGFVNDVTKILSEVNPKRQSFFFSATMDKRVRTLIETFTNDPVTIAIKASSASENVHQDVVHYSDKHDKLDKLHDKLISGEVQKAIIFDETQRSVERLSKELMSRGFNAESIHGGKTQGQRQRALSRFKQNQIDILVATDVAARGLDVADITHVFNFSIPKEYEDYIHRIGRAGRAGQVGYALTFVEKA